MQITRNTRISTLLLRRLVRFEKPQFHQFFKLYPAPITAVLSYSHWFFYIGTFFSVCLPQDTNTYFKINNTLSR